MKIPLFLLTLLLVATTLRAEETEENVSNNDIDTLCHLVVSGKSFPTAEDYLTQLKRSKKASPQSGQVSAEFDEDKARTVIAAWMSLSNEQRKAAAKSQQSCYEAIANEYESQD
ncbi:MAG: hypothetical protein XXXJIFNMEKO3_03175 [Candidatus Erwinia impunctatus]|nr:hypothetical protein XXXJIFNMEKO_03175 [Culicoides impunctatus]